MAQTLLCSLSFLALGTLKTLASRFPWILPGLVFVENRVDKYLNKKAKRVYFEPCFECVQRASGVAVFAVVPA